MAFFHCQFDCAEECVRHQQPCQVPTSLALTPMPNPNDCVNLSIHDDLAPTHVQSPGTPMRSK